MLRFLKKDLFLTLCVCVLGEGNLHVALGGQRCLIPLELDYGQL